MAKTQDIKRRIRSVKNTMQLTKAMKMVAAAKLRRAQERILKARPYAQQMSKVLRSLASRAQGEEHPLLQDRGGQHVEVVVVSADRGLCGAFNAGVIRTAERFNVEQTEAGREVKLNAVGRKGRDYFSRRTALVRERTDVFRQVDYATAEEIATDLMQRFQSREMDTVYLVYNEFKSAIQATPIVKQLLPIERIELPEDASSEDYIYEPSAEDLFEALLPQFVKNQVFTAMLESAAAEQAARMTAMESATNNAGELIESLTLTMNRVRQASITTEIIEVVSGAEALG